MNQAVKTFEEGKQQAKAQLAAGDIDQDRYDLLIKNVNKDLIDSLAQAESFKPARGPTATEQDIERQVQEVYTELKDEKKDLVQQYRDKKIDEKQYQKLIRALGNNARERINRSVVILREVIR